MLGNVKAQILAILKENRRKTEVGSGKQIVNNLSIMLIFKYFQRIYKICNNSRMLQTYFQNFRVFQRS